LLSVVEVLPVFGHVVVKYTVIVDMLLFNVEVLPRLDSICCFISNGF